MDGITRLKLYHPGTHDLYILQRRTRGKRLVIMDLLNKIQDIRLDPSFAASFSSCSVTLDAYKRRLVQEGSRVLGA